jgi:gliding motility-associated-like protein
VPAMVTTTPSPVANFTGTPTQTSIFEPWISFTDLSSGEIKWFYSFGDGQTDTIPNPMHTYGYAGIFNVMEVVTNQFGCTDTAYFPITIIPEYRFWIPNAFTPFNNDDINLVFMPVVLGVTDYEFLIFDRWGQLIFETQDIKKGWDGTYKGNKCQIDIYVWKITYTDVIDLLQHTHIGHVTLVK